MKAWKASLYGQCIHLNDVVSNGFSKDKDYYTLSKIFKALFKAIDIFGVVNVYVEGKIANKYNINLYYRLKLNQSMLCVTCIPRVRWRVLRMWWYTPSLRCPHHAQGTSRDPQTFHSPSRWHWTSPYVERHNIVTLQSRDRWLF